MTAIAAGRSIAGRRPAAERLRRLRIALFYWWRHGRWPDLDHPRTFTEWVQWRKLNDKRASLAALTDKLHSKAVAARLCGPALIVPTLWSGTALPDQPPGPLPLMVKANHGCGQYRVIRTIADWQRARAPAAAWLASTYGGVLDEGQYRSARRLILIEPLLGAEGETLPDDFKIYVFGGRAAVIQHHCGRGIGAHRWTQFDREWRRIGGAASGAQEPAGLSRMIAAAERLACGYDFLRVDLYHVGGRIWFGEFSLFPGSGLDPFEPVTLDRDLGELWTAARTG